LWQDIGSIHDITVFRNIKTSTMYLYPEAKGGWKKLEKNEPTRRQAQGDRQHEQQSGGQAEGGRLIFVTFPHMRSPFRNFHIAVHQVVCSPICPMQQSRNQINQSNKSTAPTSLRVA
jgi:hypothetical protein